MSTVILSGTTLLEYVQQAQNICGTDFPIIGLNRQYHIEPSKTFNSLPHTEVDFFEFLYHHQKTISTHYLTQRQTYISEYYHLDTDISTHYLTQRQTKQRTLRGKEDVISTHYLTQRQTFISRDQFRKGLISTHYLTQRQTQ